MKKKILLVEDEVIIAMSETQVLNAYGFDVITASSGEEALEIVDKTPDINLILMDINLGIGIDGTKAASQILETHDLPVIFLSSHTDREIVERTEGITSYGYIVKDSGDVVLIASIKMAFKLFDARQKERESEELFRGIYDESPIAIELFDSDGLLYHANKACLELFGLKDISTIKNYSLFNDPFLSEENSQKLLSGETVKYEVPFDFVMYNADGRYNTERTGVIYLHVLISPLKNKGYLLQIKDITRIKSAEEESIISKLQLNAVIESSKDIFILAVDTERRLLLFNSALKEELLNINGIQVYKGMPLDDCFTVPAYRDEIKNNIKRALKGEHFNIIQDYRADNKFFYDITYNPIIDQTGKIAGVTLFIKDITEIMTTTRDLERALANNTSLLQELRHRVKNNLTMFTSIIKLEMEESRDPSALHVLENIHGRIKSISSLYEVLNETDDVMTIRLDLYLEKVINNVVSLHRQNNFVIQKLINLDEITVNFRVALPIGLIVNELLTNIFKHAFNGREEGEININLINNTDSIELKVADNGVGFSKDYTRGLGLELISLLSQQLGADYKREENNGVMSWFTIPSENSC